VFVCLLGIASSAFAGLTKEREMSGAEKMRALAEFDFRKGLLVAKFSGIMSACFAFALTAGDPIGQASLAAGTDPISTGLSKLIVVLLGGFTTNFIWCVVLNVRNHTGYQYLASRVRPEHSDVPGTTGINLSAADLKVPVLRHYFLSALAGSTWYFHFFFYTMGETQMGRFGFASWTLHMASIIFFSTMWGWIFHEWKGASMKAHDIVAVGVSLLIPPTVIIGFGSWLGG